MVERIGAVLQMSENQIKCDLEIEIKRVTCIEFHSNEIWNEKSTNKTAHTQNNNCEC